VRKHAQTIVHLLLRVDLVRRRAQHRATLNRK
jgi:hypothetical protein